MLLKYDIERTNLVAEITTTQNHVFSYTITTGAEISDPNTPWQIAKHRIAGFG